MLAVLSFCQVSQQSFEVLLFIISVPLVNNYPG